MPLPNFEEDIRELHQAFRLAAIRTETAQHSVLQAIEVHKRIEERLRKLEEKYADKVKAGT